MNGTLERDGHCHGEGVHEYPSGLVGASGALQQIAGGGCRCTGLQSQPT